MYIIYYIANRYVLTLSNGVKWILIITIYYYYSTYILPMPMPSSNTKCLWTDYKIIITNNIYIECCRIESIPLNLVRHDYDNISYTYRINIIIVYNKYIFYKVYVKSQQLLYDFCESTSLAHTFIHLLTRTLSFIGDLWRVS